MLTLTPKLFVISRPSWQENNVQAFLDSEGETWIRSNEISSSESIVELAGRICYMSFGDRQFRRINTEYVRNLIEQGHESVLEHATWSLILTGVTRAFSHQFVRHRVGFSFSQLSQQYHDEREATFIEPRIIAKFPQLSALWSDCVENCRKTYEKMLLFLQTQDLKELSVVKKREIQRAVRTAARSVLPNATETKIFFTANARALRHFLSVRGDIAGDEEMRQSQV